MTTSALSERRRPDRERMAAFIEELITKCGSTFTREEGGSYPGPHAIYLSLIAPGGLQLTVEFDGDSSQPDVYVLSWHMCPTARRRLNNATFGGNVNPSHMHKATYIAYGFEDLCSQLEFGLMHAKCGSAYLPEQDTV